MFIGSLNESLYNQSMNVLFILFLLMLPFQDSGLSETALNYMGLYLSNIPLIIMVILTSCHIIYSGKINFPYIYHVLVIFMYIIIYSLIVCVYINEDIMTSLYKTIVGCITLFLQIYVFFIAKSRIYIIKKYIWMTFWVNILGWLMCDIFNWDMGMLIHRSLGDNRFHGFASETSWFSFTSIILGILSIASTERNPLKFVYFISTMIIVFYGGSKGTVACLPLAVLIFVLFCEKTKFWLKLIIICFTLVLSGFIVEYFLLEGFVFDLSEYTSTATRFSSIIASMIMVIDYPFGTGYGAFQNVLRVYYLEAFDILNSYIPLFNLSYAEIISLINSSSGSGLSIKSVLFQYITYFGISFILFIVWGINKIKHAFWALDSYWKISCLFVVIGLVTFAQFFYDSIVFFAVLFSLYDINKMAER